LQRGHAATDAGMAELGLVHGHNHSGEPDTIRSAACLLVFGGADIPNTGQGPPRVHVVDGLGTGLEGTTEAEDDGPDEDGQSTAECVARRSGAESTYKGSAREDGHDGAATASLSAGYLLGVTEGTLTSHRDYHRSAA
jgi:hypothetical protein